MATGTKTGRPRREEGPRLPADEVDALLVEGETVVGDDGQPARRWPSQRELAQRFGVAPSLVAAFAKKHGCAERRAAFESGALPPKNTVVEAPPLVTPPTPVGESAPEPPPPRARGPGRPHKADAPVIPYEELDRLLVFGRVQQLDDGTSTTVYPSQRELAEKYGVAQSVIAGYSKSHNCRRRREEAQARIAVRTEEKLIEARASEFAVTKDDAIRMIDGYLVNFEKALQEGRVRFDNPTDFNTMVRLKEYVLGGADSRQEIHAVLSLESLQQRHARMLREVNETTPELSGVVDVRAVDSEQPAGAQFPEARSLSTPPPLSFDEPAGESITGDADDVPPVAPDVGSRGPNEG